MTERQNEIRFIRERITQLRLRRGVSEHRMSLDLDKSGGYLRGISSGSSVPSLPMLIRICHYLGVGMGEFFTPISEDDSTYGRLCRRLRGTSEKDLEKVWIFLDLIGQ